MSRNHAPPVPIRLVGWAVVSGLLALLTQVPLTAASTTVTPFSSSAEGARVVVPATPPKGVAVVNISLVLLTATVPGPTAVSGRQTAGTVGLAGSTARLGSCNLGPCTRQYRPAGAAGLKAGHWAVEVRLTVVQPSFRLAKPSGFGVEVAVRAGAGWVAAWAYYSTGLSRAVANQTIDLNLWVDLGTTIRPSSLPVVVAIGPCASTAVCP
ncbi:MAG TPA: hypothetical protein VEY07_02785 [Thermoplasmata archaeon]|nr:hypothetical protein [Thermoplasmata archaeon]